MSKISPEKWQNAFKWNYEAYPFFCSVYQKNSTPVSRRYFVDWDVFLNRFQGSHLYAFLPRKELVRVGNKITRELLRGDDSFLKIFKKVYGEIKTNVDVCLEARKNNEYENLDKWWFPTQITLSHVGQILFSFDYPLDDYLRNLQKESPQDFEILSKYIQAKKPSFIDEANDRLLRLNRKYPKDFDKVYAIFMSEFGWFQNSYKGVFKINKLWLKKHLAEIKKEKPKNRTKTKIKLPKRYKLLAETAKLGIIFRDDKKKLLLIAAELMETWLKDVCRKNSWKFEELRLLTVDEVLELLGVKKEYLVQAKKYAQKKERLGLLTPVGYKKVPKDLWEKVYALNLGDGKVKEIKGVVANKGRYQGIAKIITNIKKDGHKLKKGDVLVTSMTRPEYLPLMKKAGAFVTDEGGITSHASIVAREMNKPCIIGTRIATKVLKDGDIVEVDANKGIIKILK
jgi:phosphohistidine swiveling domain-containing protein